MKDITLKIEYITDGSNWKNESIIFRDGSFCMKSFQLDYENGSFEIINQQVVNSGINIMHFSMNPDSECHIKIDYPEDAVITGQGLFSKADGGTGIWIPLNPFIRKYDSHGRIVESTGGSDFRKSVTEKIEYSIRPPAFLEFTVVQFVTGYNQYLAEITCPSEIETMHVTKAKWFDYSGISDLFRYSVRGQFYQVHHIESAYSWPCQLLSYTLYRHMESISLKTNRKLYSSLLTWIAYSVLVSLPQDGRWKHGQWSDENETHCIFQAKGIQLLVAFYERCRKDIFITKAKCALDYLITLRDNLDDNLPWFLHDSLELSLDKARLFYKNIFESRAFGKSPSNTLCINTHISTIITLHQYGMLDNNPEYSQLFKDGLNALRKVLSEKPAGFRYRLFYRIRDWMNNYSGNNHLLIKLNKKYTTMFKSGILPYLKKKYPRINMPQGFLERDLTNSCLSDGYHLVNIRYLLYLYDICKAGWIYEIISRSTMYTLKYSIADKMKYDPRSNIIMEILFLISRYDKKYDKYFRKYLDRLRRKNEPLNVDVLSAACRNNFSAASELIHSEYRLPLNINKNNTAN